MHVSVVHFSKTETNTQHPKPGHHRGKKRAKMGHLATMATNYLPVTIHIILLLCPILRFNTVVVRKELGNCLQGLSLGRWWLKDQSEIVVSS